MSTPFRVGITRDFLTETTETAMTAIGMESLLHSPNLELEFIPSEIRLLSHEHLRSLDALLLGGARITEQSFAGGDRLAIVARFGVGYDNVDTAICTAHDVMLTITPDGVRRPVAVGAITFMLALSHKLLIKDKLTREGRWAEKLNFMGDGVTGRTLGMIGLGNIGREVLRLAMPFDMRHLAFDPYGDPTAAAGLRAELVSLDRLLAESDYVCITCALTPETHHLLNAERLRQMKPSAYLINVARGPIVDQVALTNALRSGQIQGAGIDVFEQEPVDPNDPVLTLENVIVAPHGIVWTHECFQGNGRSASESIIAVSKGQIPHNVVNREVLDRPGMQAKLARRR